MSMHSFTVSGIAKCPYSITLDYAAAYLERFSSGADDTLVTLPYRALGLPIAGGLRRRVHLEFGITEDLHERSRSHEALHFNWNARSAFLPNFHGLLGFRIAGDRLADLSLDCSYEPPLGAFGGLFDRIIGRRLARATAEALLARVIADIETQERAFLATFAPIVAPL